MPKSKIFFIIVTLAITLMGCSQEGTFIQGDITDINKESGDMEIDIVSWTTISDTGSSTGSHQFEKKPKSQTIRVSNPEKYHEGQKVQVKVIKNYDEDEWDIDRLKFDVKQLN
ncbi:hypothetical protein [Halobacillus hunanensis]|uniref:hypothetical protein n=1 Tax=Halobacillus hunanensis TaxID=578214 RepID=UPI0009A6626A|nr:hypothetical protein [Halobacillus hunanensis]